MGLRSQNPMIDSDLELIITSFEKAMAKSRDVDSVLVPFRRQMPALANYPKSIIESIDGIPLPSRSEEGDSSVKGPTVPRVTSSPELLKGDPLTPIEDGDDDDDLNKKIKDWVADCVPCSGEKFGTKFGTGAFSFEASGSMKDGPSSKRTLSAMDADFFKDVGKKWDSTLDEIEGKLNNFEDFLSNSDEDLLSAFCDLGNALMDQCSSDLKKIQFVLSMMLNRMELEFSLDLGIIDSFLMAALSPIFNQLAANLDLIADLALDPLRCVLDYMQYQINNAPRLAQEAKASILDSVKLDAQNKRLRMQAALRNKKLEISNNKKSGKSEAELAAERARLQKQYLEALKKSGQQVPSAIQRSNNALKQTQDATNYLENLSSYLTEGVSYLEDKKEWLFNLIEEFINDGMDKWEANMDFAQGKSNLLNMLSIVSATVSSAQNGDISCGPDSNGMTEENVLKIVRHWQHPSESLEIIIEDDNIITRRIPKDEKKKEKDGRGIVTGSQGPDSGSSNIQTAFSNIVARRPISSCLKKVTADEAEQINRWISQLELEV
jgi:hypothetical protein